MEIRKITQRDLNEVVKIHVDAFPQFFLSFLGPRFLKIFYASFLHDNQGIGLVAVEDGKVTGAVVGCVEPEGYFKRLLIRKWYAFCFASIGAVLRKPTIIKRLLRAVFYRGQSPPGKKRSLLSSIAVSPHVQRKGVGGQLVLNWLNEIKSRGSKGAFLTTDAENNAPVNRFYQSLGWKLDSTYETPEGRKMNCYVHDFEESEA